MVTRIQLGNLVNNGGKTTLSGSASGLDTKAIVDALVEAKRLPAVRIEDKNKAIDAQSKALTELKNLLARFKSATDVLRNPPGVSNASSNIFQYRTTTLSATAGFTADNYISVAAQPGASVQSFNINNIDRLAREARQETAIISLADTTTASAVGTTPTAGQFTAGTFTVRNVTGGADVSITLEDGDTLQAVANKFNEASDRTGFRANIIKVANGTPENDYKIIYTATKTGETYGFDLNAPGTVTSDPNGVFANVGVTTTQGAQNARFFVDNIEIIRETNTVDDVFEGLTFTLKQATGGVPNINVGVRPDTDIVQNALMSFVDVYNEFRLFAAKQTEIGEDGFATETAILSNDASMRSVISRIGNEMASVVAGISGGNPERLADIGLSFSNFEGDEDNPATRNIVTVDTDKLKSALTANFEGVRDLFEFRLQADNSNLTIYKRTNSLSVTNFSLALDRTAGTYVASYTDAQGNARTVNFTGTTIGDSVTLKGPAGSVFEGLELIYAVAGDANINVSITQGLGDRVFNSLDDILKADGGVLTTALTQLADQVARNKTEVTRIDEQMVTYRAQLEAQYSALEAALTKANNLLTLLDAQARARDSA